MTASTSATTTPSAPAACPCSLHAGANTVLLKLSNDRGSNHGGWAFAFRAETADGTALIPHADHEK